MISKLRAMRCSDIVLIGPLPPPFGGARVSFADAVTTFNEETTLQTHIIDFPSRRKLNGKKFGSVSKSRSIRAALHALVATAISKRVLFFSSANSMLNFGSILALIAQFSGCTFVGRFFGGRPSANLRNANPIIRRAQWKSLSRAAALSIETAHGSKEVSRLTGSPVAHVPGFRSNPAVPKTASTKSKSLLYIGEVSRAKGACWLASAWQQYKETSSSGSDATLTVVGQISTEGQAAFRSCQGVHLTGPLPNPEVLRLLAECSALVMPSLSESEGHPGAIIEAFSAGKPVIGSRVGGIPEMVHENRNGLLIKPNDREALSSAINRLLSNPELLDKLSSNALAQSSDFTTSVFVQKILAIFTRIERDSP